MLHGRGGGDCMGRGLMGRGAGWEGERELDGKEGDACLMSE